MESLILLNASVLLGVSLVLFQSKNLIRVFLGVFLSSHALHLVVYLMGHSATLIPPFTDAQGEVSNPLPQALILTSIVISFAIALICLGMAYAYQRQYQCIQLEKEPEL